MVKVVLCGTHPSQYNGYSKVVFELANYIGKTEFIDLHIFGFQNFYDGIDHRMERALPSTVKIYDAFANEDPKAKGFGEANLVSYLLEVNPDIVIIYNDLIIVNTFLEKIHNGIPERKFLVIPYIDIVYRNEKNSLISRIELLSDAGIMFTEHWKQVITMQGFKKPLYVLEHGFNKHMYYPVPKELARTFFNINKDDFIILNLNRNQPRKRWDLCIMVFVKFIANNRDKKIRMVIAAAMQGSWDLIDLLISESRKYGMELKDIKDYLIIIQNPQQLTDFEINVMYNLADVGINTCDGEGFGLCNFEQAGVGVPQIVPNIGGFRDFFSPSTAILLDPKWSFYCDHTRDFVSGEAQICDVDEFVAALQFMYDNPTLRVEMGQQARNHIMENYTWESKGEQFEKIIRSVWKDPQQDMIPIEMFNLQSTLTELSTSEPKAGISPSDIDDVDLDKMDTEQLKAFIKNMRAK
jgi:D-inositol-3-phosphate glycosyltransferase